MRCLNALSYALLLLLVLLCADVTLGQTSPSDHSGAVSLPPTAVSTAVTAVPPVSSASAAIVASSSSPLPVTSPAVTSAPLAVTSAATSTTRPATSSPRSSSSSTRTSPSTTSAPPFFTSTGAFSSISDAPPTSVGRSLSPTSLASSTAADFPIQLSTSTLSAAYGPLNGSSTAQSPSPASPAPPPIGPMWHRSAAQRQRTARWIAGVEALCVLAVMV